MKITATILKNSLILMTLATAFSCSESTKVIVDGELKTWHTVTLTFPGPETSESDTLNPFTWYRLDVEFSSGDNKMVVPGYYAADGNAAESSATRGNKWRVKFSPPAPGTWSYRVSFVRGRNISVSGDPASGEKCFIDGLTGSLEIAPTDKSSPDFRAKGRIIYTGSRYLKHAGTGELFLKGGADSPENFLGYKDFDGTYYGGNNKQRSGEAAPNNGLHKYDPHVVDWKPGDPSWKGGKGKGMIGALNYLSLKGVNSIYFLTLNILGDGEDVWPYTDRNERYRFDCSKLDQWEIVFSHADKLGIMLHIVLQETENECLLDCGYLDVQRKLYLRELAARFSHHPGITWNLGEEHHAVEWSPYGQTYRDTKLMADYLRDIDPYDNFIVIHTHASPRQARKDMSNYLGFNNVEGPSIQCGNVDDIHGETIFWIEESGRSGKQWVVSLDEAGPHWKGALPDAADNSHDTIRHKVLYANLMAGGAGVEWYFGYSYPHSDLSCEDFRSRDILWEQTRIALDLFHKYLPFPEMKSADHLTSDPDDYCFAREGEIYAVYLPDGKSTNIMVGKGVYNIRWYDPRSGGDLREGSVNRISGPGTVSTGNPPAGDAGKDWVCIVKRSD